AIPTQSIAALQTAHASLMGQQAPARIESTVPPVFTLAPTAATAAAELASAPYRVRRGDALTHIARQALQTSGSEPSNAAVQAAVERIARDNGLRNPNLIQPGQQLDLSGIRPMPETKSAPIHAAERQLANSLARPLASPARSEARL